MIRLPPQNASSAAPFDSYPTGARQRARFSSRSTLLVGLAGLLFLLFLSFSSQAQDGYGRVEGLVQSFVGPVQRPLELESICANCNCTVPGSFLLSAQYSKPIPSLAEVRAAKATKATIKRYLLHAISQYLWLHPHFLPETATAPLFTQYFTCPDALIRYDFRDLQQGKPTLYMYTRTGDGGRLKANERRMTYFRKHIETIRSYDDLIAREGFRDGLKAQDRQLLWILIEDGDRINETLDELMRVSGIPYIYFAHGPTHFYGNAQWNAAERAVHVLRDTFFGDGPVLNVDDDSRILPELLQRIWKVQKAVFWQVGNLGSRADMWEGPVFAKGKIVDWIIGGMPNRKFPQDMGGFAYNSTLVGTGRAIDGPAYVPENHFGGESEFLSQIIESRDEVEPLCENTIAEKCYFTWHNWITPNEEANTKPLV